MPKQVFKVCFFMFILLSLNQISFSQPKEANQTISTEPSEFSLDSVPESTQETLSPENFSVSSNDSAPSLESGNQTSRSPEYSKDVTPESVEEPDFFAPEKYSLPPFAEALATEPELITEADDHNTQINASTTAQSTDLSLQETESVTAEPEIQLEADVNKSGTKTAGAAPSPDVTLPEVEPLSTEPKFEAGVDDGNNTLNKVISATPSVPITLPEMDVDSTPAIPLDEEANEFPLSPPVSPNSSTAEDREIAYPESEINDNNSTISDTSSELTLPGVDTESTQDQEASPLIGYDVPSVPHGPPVSPYTYVAEDETYDIVYVEDKDSWSSWAGENPLVMAGGVIGVCFVGLAGLVYNNRKKKKTQSQYQLLTKGI